MARFILIVIALLYVSSSIASDKTIYYNQKGGFYPSRCSFVTVDRGNVYVFVCQHIKGVVRLVLRDTILTKKNNIYSSSKCVVKIHDTHCELRYQDKRVVLYPVTQSQIDLLKRDEEKVEK